MKISCGSLSGAYPPVSIRVWRCATLQRLSLRILGVLALLSLVLFQQTSLWVAGTYTIGISDLGSDNAGTYELPLRCLSPICPTIGPSARISIFRPSTGQWFFDTNGDGVTNRVVRYGSSTDTLVPADYDGDELPDLAVFRAGRWFIDTDQNGVTNLTVQYGITSDIPLQLDAD
jgi:hypothetical protein